MKQFLLFPVQVALLLAFSMLMLTGAVFMICAGLCSTANEWTRK